MGCANVLNNMLDVYFDEFVKLVSTWSDNATCSVLTAH